MAINISIQDLINFPGNVKSMNVDQVSIVPQGSEGDEKYVMKFSTSAYSDIENRTSIQDYYVTNFKSGWVKSSGFAGSAGQFNLTSGVNRLLIKLDSTTSGTNGNGYYEIILDYNDDDTPMSVETVVEDLETKIRAIADNLDTVDIGYKFAYQNASVEYKNNKIWIVSGTVSNFYNGANRSYADVISGTTNDALGTLGFDLKTSSASLDSVSINEALVAMDYETGASGIVIGQNVGAVDGSCIFITDRTNSDYFQVDASPTMGGTVLSFSSTAITHNYTANITKVQLLKEQDPDGDPSAWFSNIDKVTRHGIKCIVNSIDFSE